MKNLENYGVQSLNAKEIRETEGGQIDPEQCWWVLDVAYDYITSLDWDGVLNVDPNMGIPISA